MTTRVECAKKAIELYDELGRLFEVRRPLTAEVALESQKALSQFDSIYRALLRQRFELERIVLGDI